MAKREWLINIAILLVGIVFVIGSLNLGLGDIHRPKAGFLPFCTGLMLSILSILSLLKGFSAKGIDKEEGGVYSYDGSIINVIIISVSLIIYALILNLLGYLISTFLLLIFLFKVGGVQKWTTSLLAALLSVSLTYVLFCILLNMRFPKGILGI